MARHRILKTSQFVLSTLLAVLMVNCGSDEEVNTQSDDSPSVSLIFAPTDNGIFISNLSDR